MYEKKFESEFWTIEKKNNKNFIYKNQKWLGFKSFLKIIIHLLKWWKKIDILHLYHIWRYPYILWIVYKIINWNWKIYLKTDLAYKNINWKKVLNINKKILKIFFNIFDYVWIEDKFILKEFREKLPTIKNKFLFTPSWTLYLKEFDCNFKKKNIISLCWRFWDKIKNYEIFLESLEKNKVDFLSKWKIYFIWEYSQEFKNKINRLIEIKPELKNILILKWFINDKIDLFYLLSESKIFIHTAISEWEPNIQFDAMFCWCYMISSDVWTIKDNYPKKHSSFFNPEDNKDLYKKLKDNINDLNNWNNNNYLNIQKHCIKNFIWNKSLKKILNKF